MACRDILRKGCPLHNPSGNWCRHVYPKPCSAIRNFTEELLGASTLEDLHDTRAKLFNGRNVAGEDTHVTRNGSNVDLGNSGILVDGLQR